MRFTVTALLLLPTFWALSALGHPDRKLLYRCKAKNYSGYLAGLFGLRDMNSLGYVSWRGQSTVKP
jgi:hypothetical protein